MKKTVDAFDKFRIVQLPWYCFWILQGKCFYHIFRIPLWNDDSHNRVEKHNDNGFYF